MQAISTATGYFIGLDLGDRADYTALTVARQHQVPTGRWILDQAPETMFAYDVIHVDRWRGIGYKAALPRIKVVLDRLPQLTHEERTKEGILNVSPLPVFVLIDHTSLGRPVLEDMRASGLNNAVGITFTAGHKVNRDGRDYMVPKTALVSSLRVAVENHRIATANIPMREILEGELQNLRRKTKLSTGHESIEAGTDWRENAHDDVVFSLAMAIWYGEDVNPVARMATWDAIIAAWTA